LNSARFVSAGAVFPLLAERIAVKIPELKLVNIC
jgi:hypothetical protein